MKKRLFVVLVLIIFLCSACNGNVTRDLRHAGFSVGDKFKCSYFYPNSKNDTGYKKVKYLTNSNIVDEDGNIYDLSLGQVYSNKENCKKSDTSIKVKAIYDNKIIKGMDNKYYYLVSENSVPSFSEVLNTNNSYELYDILLKDNDVVKVITANSSTGIYYVLKTDGNVYSYTISKDDYNSPLKVTGTKIIYDKSNYDSKIIDFNYAGNSTSTYIRTNNSVYRMQITNYDKCSKYADVSCKYKMKKDSIFEKYNDKIIAYNGNVLITDYNQVFNSNN